MTHHATPTASTTDSGPVSERSDAMTAVLDRFAELDDIARSLRLLGWDRQTKMPDAHAEARGYQMAALSSILHDKLTDPGLGELVEAARAAGANGDDALQLERAQRDIDEATKLPRELVAEIARASSRGHSVWVRARANDDFASFAPELERMLELRRREAEHLGWTEHPYDALHDKYEIGSTTARVRSVFEPLKAATKELVEAIRASGIELDDGPVRQHFPADAQRAFAAPEAARFGYDFDRGRLDDTVHPFANGMGRTDVRITTRYDEEFLNTAMFGIFHEAGHAMYEQGLRADDMRTPLGHSISLAIHESQSRMWENLVGRSRPFWRGAYPRLQAAFPAQLGGVDRDAFYRAINRVEPSLIRVEADEVTYNLHIMIRFDLEVALIEGSLAVADLPEAWNAAYEELLGVTPTTDREGVLQDVHWSAGSFGYFPTYALGNLASVQLFDAAADAIPDLEAKIETGEFAPLLGWLNEHVHEPGARYLPDDLLARATGAPLTAEPYLAYLRGKFGELYGLND